MATENMRTGAELLRSLDDGRQVFLDGERVGKVTEHPAFREAARSIARLFDVAAAPELREPWPKAALGELLSLLGSGRPLVDVVESLDAVIESVSVRAPHDAGTCRTTRSADCAEPRST